MVGGIEKPLEQILSTTSKPNSIDPKGVLYTQTRYNLIPNLIKCRRAYLLELPGLKPEIQLMRK
jgi:hypothetical protein